MKPTKQANDRAIEKELAELAAMPNVIVFSNVHDARKSYHKQLDAVARSMSHDYSKPWPPKQRGRP